MKITKLKMDNINDDDDIGLNILKYLESYNTITKCNIKIKLSCLIRLEKFISIFIKIVYSNAYLCSCALNRKYIPFWIINRVIEIILRGYEVNVNTFYDDYFYITNPLNNDDKSYIVKCLDNQFTPVDIDIKTFILPIKKFAKHFEMKYIGKISEKTNVKYDHEYTMFKHAIFFILSFILRSCNHSDEKLNPDNEYIINDEVLSKIAEMDEIIKIDNVLGGNDILKYDIPNLEKNVFKEIKIDDLVEDYDEKEISFRNYPSKVSNLIIT